MLGKLSIFALFCGLAGFCANAQQQGKLPPVAGQPAPAATVSATTPPGQASPITPASAGEPAKPPLTPRQISEMHAQIMMARKQYGGAIVMYLDLLKQYPKDAGLLNQVGIAYQELGAHRDATHYYKKAVHADRHFASPLNNLGTIEYEQKRYAKAVKLYQKALAERGDAATVYCNLGYAYFAQKQYPDAMVAFNKALALDANIFERHGGEGSIIQQRSVTDPGMFYLFVARTYAGVHDAERCTHYLKLARDEGYPQFASIQTDPQFAFLANDPEFKMLFAVEKPMAETR